jgi:hypothetical protein
MISLLVRKNGVHSSQNNINLEAINGDGEHGLWAMGTQWTALCLDTLSRCDALRN